MTRNLVDDIILMSSF